MGGHNEQPPDLPQLPFLDLQQWLSKHPASGYFQPEPMGKGEAAEKIGIGVGLEVAGHVVEALEPIGWLHFAWEVFEAGADIKADIDRPEKQREAQREAWGAFMWEKFWADETVYYSSDAREQAFDQLAGDNANHGVVPALTREAALERQALINQINDRWLVNVQGIEALTQYLEKGEGGMRLNVPRPEVGSDIFIPVPPSDPNQRTVDWVRAGSAQQELERYKAEITTDLKTVMEFDVNPTHWDLTPDQREMLHGLTSEMPANSSPMPPGSGGADPAVSDGSDGIYDIIGGRPD